MNNITGIKSQLIESVLSKVKRQYFVGNLTMPQDIPFIKESNLEIGITFYEEETTEEPHFHPVQNEFGYILQGESTWIEVEGNIKTIFKEGDFFHIKSNTCYTQTSKANTKILFIKTPSINDKKVCESCEKDCANKL